MDVPFIRKVDRWLGVPLCFLLTLHRRIFDPGPPAGPPETILFLKPAEQGSTLLAREAISLAMERVGPQRVYLLVFQENRSITDIMDLLPPANILTIRAAPGRAFVADVLSCLRRLRRLAPLTTVDLEFFARFTAALSYLSGARRRVGFHAFDRGPYRGDLLTHPMVFNPYLHTRVSFTALAEAAFLPAGDDLPAFPWRPTPSPASHPPFRPTPVDEADAERLLAEFPSPGPLLLLHPNPGDLLPLRQWPLGRYGQLARRLLAERDDLCIAVTGLAEETIWCRRLVEMVGSPRCLSFAGRTTLRGFLTLASRAVVLVSSDCGPAHFAALTPVETVVLFGPETPLLFSAASGRDHNLFAGLACSPCFNAQNGRESSCRRNLCLEALSVDEVHREISAILFRRPGALP